MPAKPSTVPTWATDATYTGGAEAGTNTKVAPSGSRQNEGWEPAAKPPAQEFNWWKNLVGQWCSFKNNFFTNGGGATGQTDIGSPAEATYSPLAAWRDWNGRARATIDHLGYRGGQVSEWDEHWRTTGTTEPSGWNFTTSAGGTRAYSDPSLTGLNQRSVVLTSPATNGLAQVVTNYLFTMTDDTVAAMECMVRTGTNVDLGDAAQFAIGFGFDHAAAQDYFVEFFGDLDVNANWQTQVVGSSTDNANSSVALTANTTYRMRIELIGNNLSSLASKEARFFINGNLIRSVAVTTIPDDLVALRLRCRHPGADAGNYILTVGRVRCTWNHLATSDNL